MSLPEIKNFGYDPVFYFPQLGKTMAELSSDIKNRSATGARAAAKPEFYWKVSDSYSA
jgi:inosine/xanthosine triphosphate pyrophosphatase family protein